MRWKEKQMPEEGAMKSKTVFLLLPLTLKGETRWLERAVIKYVFETNRSSGGGWGSPPQWWAMSFID